MGALAGFAGGALLSVVRTADRIADTYNLDKADVLAFYKNIQSFKDAKK